VLRTKDNKEMTNPLNYKEATSSKKPEQNILLKPGDVIVIP
jgi:hypothetical protein